MFIHSLSFFKENKIINLKASEPFR